MKKIITIVLLVIIIALAVLGACKLLSDKKADTDSLHVTDQASESKPGEDDSSTTKPTSVSEPDNQIDPAPTDPGTDEPDITDKSETKEPESDRDKETQLFFYAEGSAEGFMASLFVSDFGLPEAGNVYSIYVDNERFTYERYNNADIFRTESGAEMEIALHRGTTGEALLPSFADSYIDFTDIEYDGVTTLDATGLKGYIINAYNATECVRTYLIDHDGDVITVVMSYSPEMAEGFLRRMISMFDSFEFEG